MKIRIARSGPFERQFANATPMQILHPRHSATCHNTRGGSASRIFSRARLHVLSQSIAGRGSNKRMFDPCLCLDDQPRASIGDTRARKIVATNDAGDGAKLRAAIECSLRSHRYTMGAEQQAYRMLFHGVIDEELLARIRKNTNACGVIGDNRFKEQIEAILGRAVPTGKRGRPKLVR